GRGGGAGGRGAGARAGLLVEQHGEIALGAVREAELRIGRKAARQMFPRIEAKLEKARKRALHRRARLGGRGRNRQAMKVLHRRPPERIPSRSPLRASARGRCLLFFVPVSYRTRAICGDIRGKSEPPAVPTIAVGRWLRRARPRRPGERPWISSSRLPRKRFRRAPARSPRRTWRRAPPKSTAPKLTRGIMSSACVPPDYSA